jgi:hypothetical protein
MPHRKEEWMDIPPYIEHVVIRMGSNDIVLFFDCPFAGVGTAPHAAPGYIRPQRRIVACASTWPSHAPQE